LHQRHWQTMRFARKPLEKPVGGTCPFATLCGRRRQTAHSIQRGC
jgi:hypothetical protein